MRIPSTVGTTIAVALLLAGCTTADSSMPHRTALPTPNAPAPTGPYTPNPAVAAQAAALLRAENERLSADFAMGKAAADPDSVSSWWRAVGDAGRLKAEMESAARSALKLYPHGRPASIAEWAAVPLPADLQAYATTRAADDTADSAQIETDLAQLEAYAQAVADGH